MDLVIRGGRVMDPETGFDAVSNVGIEAGRIVEITEAEVDGDDVIDASGYIVCPGFIDTHSHAAVTPYGGKLGLRLGVTAAVDFEARALSISDWYAERNGGWQLNYGTTVSQEFARAVVMDGYPQERLRDMRDFAAFMDAAEGDMAWSTGIASYNSAKYLGDAGVESMRIRGRLQRDMVADITVFDPETVAENSDFELGKNGLPPSGIPVVIVNGVVVVRDSEVLGDVHPGQPIRFDMEQQSRFEAIPATGNHTLMKDFPH